MKKTIPLAQRLKGQAAEADVESLEVLSRRLPFFFQGVAALTGMRSQRENLACWSRWEEEYYQGQPGRQEKIFLFWLIWAGLDLTGECDAAMFTNLILEPMYWLEECATMQEGAL